jgi:hypothetical protein
MVPSRKDRGPRGRLTARKIAGYLPLGSNFQAPGLGKGLRWAKAPAMSFQML